MIVLGLLKSGKVRVRRTIGRRNLIKLLGMQGNAHSARYGEMIHDGSGQPESANYQVEADSESFVMGNDVAEFVNKV